jgi:hypothetical protein
VIAEKNSQAYTGGQGRPETVPNRSRAAHDVVELLGRRLITHRKRSELFFRKEIYEVAVDYQMQVAVVRCLFADPGQELRQALLTDRRKDAKAGRVIRPRFATQVQIRNHKNA